MREESEINVGILLYPEVDVLEVAGPVEVFSSVSGFSVVNVSFFEEPVSCRGNLRLLPDYALSDCPHLDVLVVPGGAVKKETANAELLLWLQAMTIKTSILMSVCTGAYLLAAAGLLDGRPYTSSVQALNELPRLIPRGKAVHQKRYVDSGNIITTAGPSSGIDGALQVVKRLKGTSAAQLVAQYLEYPLWPATSGSDRMVKNFKPENKDWMGNK